MEMSEDCGWGHHPGAQEAGPAPMMRMPNCDSEEQKKCSKSRENLFSSETATQSQYIFESISKFMKNSQHLKFPPWYVVQMRSFLQGKKSLFSQFNL